MSRRVVVASGYFDPIHMGHIEYLQQSKDCGDKLIVIVNNDRQAAMKKGASFMPASERVKLVRALECVDGALEAIDNDRTVCETLKMLRPDAFTNGGDQTCDSIPEKATCEEIGCELVDGLGMKVQSSSWLLAKAKGQKVKKKVDPNE